MGYILKKYHFDLGMYQYWKISYDGVKFVAAYDSSRDGGELRFSVDKDSLMSDIRLAYPKAKNMGWDSLLLEEIRDTSLCTTYEEALSLAKNIIDRELGNGYTYWQRMNHALMLPDTPPDKEIERLIKCYYKSKENMIRERRFSNIFLWFPRLKKESEAAKELGPLIDKYFKSKVPDDLDRLFEIAKKYRYNDNIYYG